MRYRISRRFEGSGIQFHWQVALDALPPLSSRTILQVLRIMQEVLHNAIRHADAQHITLSAQYDASQHLLQVTIRDDGVGLPQPLRSGRGMGNMQQRAREIGADWQIRSAHPGTEMVLRLVLAEGVDPTLKPRGGREAAAG